MTRNGWIECVTRNRWIECVTGNRVGDTEKCERGTGGKQCMLLFMFSFVSLIIFQALIFSGQVPATSSRHEQREELEGRRCDGERVQRRCVLGAQEGAQRVRPRAREARRTPGTVTVVCFRQQRSSSI